MTELSVSLTQKWERKAAYIDVVVIAFNEINRWYVMYNYASKNRVLYGHGWTQLRSLGRSYVEIWLAKS